MSILGLVITNAVGIMLIVFGYLIWKKDKVGLIHSYHYSKVKDSDKKAYAEKFGKGIIFCGVGSCLMGIVESISNRASLGIIAFVLFFIIGFIFIIIAQKKYNGGFF